MDDKCTKWKYFRIFQRPFISNQRCLLSINRTSLWPILLCSSNVLLVNVTRGLVDASEQIIVASSSKRRDQSGDMTHTHQALSPRRHLRKIYLMTPNRLDDPKAATLGLNRQPLRLSFCDLVRLLCTSKSRDEIALEFYGF